MSTTLRPLDEILQLENEITSARALGDFVLRLEFSDGDSYELDFKPRIARGGVMARLSDPAVFSAVRVILDGYAIEFPGNIDFSADALRLDAELQRRGLTRADVPQPE